jgi:hypothetical protein
MLVSKIILFFIFNTVEFADVKDNSYSRVAVYDDLDEYISWAERRVDLLFCKCSSSEMSLAEKIKGMDTGIIQIFPFLGRIADRSLLIEKSLFYQDLFEKEQEEKRQTVEADAAEIEEEEVEEEVRAPPVHAAEPQPKKKERAAGSCCRTTTGKKERAASSCCRTTCGSETRRASKIAGLFSKRMGKDSVGK